MKYTFFNNKLRGVDRETVHKKNNLGFRGDPLPANDNNFIKIITIGGSTTECMYITNGKTWPDILNVKLNEFTHYTHTYLCLAEVAHLVERKPSKLQVAGSSPVFRSSPL